jgi:hypothetical protein
MEVIMSMTDWMYMDSLSMYGYGIHNQSRGTFHCDGPNCRAFQRGTTGGKPGNGWKGLDYGGKSLDFCSKPDCQKYRKKLKNKQKKVKKLEKNSQLQWQPQPVHQPQQLQWQQQQPQQPQQLQWQQQQPQQPQQDNDDIMLQDYLKKFE